jgi:hypothetical protein
MGIIGFVRGSSAIEATILITFLVALLLFAVGASTQWANATLTVITTSIRVPSDTKPEHLRGLRRVSEDRSTACGVNGGTSECPIWINWTRHVKDRSKTMDQSVCNVLMITP